MSVAVEPSQLDDLRNLRIPEAAKVIGVCNSKVYELMASGRLKSIKIDSSRRIPVRFLREFLESLDGRGE